jgi:hypothetical protein
MSNTANTDYNMKQHKCKNSTQTNNHLAPTSEHSHFKEQINEQQNAILQGINN